MKILPLSKKKNENTPSHMDLKWIFAFYMLMMF